MWSGEQMGNMKVFCMILVDVVIWMANQVMLLHVFDLNGDFKS